MPLQFNTPRPARRSVLAGIFAGIALVLLAAGIGAPLLPDTAALQGFGRILDSLAPYMLLATIWLALMVALLGQRGLAALLGLAAVAALSLTLLDYRKVAQPYSPSAPVALTVLWMNVLADNENPPEEMVAALLQTQADVLVLGEAGYLRRHMEGLSASYPYRLGCESECDLVVLSRRPLGAARVQQLSQFSGERLAIAPLATLANRQVVTLIGAHLIKPWFDEWSRLEENILLRAMGRIEGPVIVVGDFNAAPWSKRMRRLTQTTDLRFVPVPPATWPAQWGRFGVPIDHVLVGGGVNLVSLQTWGAGLGSNHLGLLAEFDLPRAASVGN